MSAQTSMPSQPEAGKDTGIAPRLWTLAEFEQAEKLGWFEGERVELIRGEVFQKLTQDPPHASSLLALLEILREAFGPGTHIRPQLPLPIPAMSRPEPDIAVVVGSWRDYTARHPTTTEVALVVEVSDTTIRTDSGSKMALYAQAAIAYYWMLNLQTRTLRIHRDPVPMPNAPGGFGYQRVTEHAEADSVTPLAAPNASVRVADLLPPVEAASPEGAGSPDPTPDPNICSLAILP